MWYVLDTQEFQLHQISQQISMLKSNLKKLLSNNWVVYLIIRSIIHSFNQQLYSFLNQLKKDIFNQLRPQCYESKQSFAVGT